MTVAPTFLQVSRWTLGERRFEIVSRPRLDTRQIVPFYRNDEGLHVGALERRRASRQVRGDEPVGLEPIGVDFRGVDETGDVRAHGRAIFGERTHLAIDEAASVMPLPSVARSIGWATELALPLLLPIEPPTATRVPVSWDGQTHAVVFHPIEALRARLAERPHDEALGLALAALAPPPARKLAGPAGSPRESSDAARLSAAVHRHERIGTREVAAELSFLRLDRREDLEVITPGTGRSIAVLPWVHLGDEPHFLLWIELRASALERRARQPIFDLPVSSRHVNATGRWVTSLEGAPEEVAQEVLRETFGVDLAVISAVDLGIAEPAPAFGNELRRRVACALDPASLGRLPDDAVLISARELVSAVRRGLVRDPVVVTGLLELGFDPFVDFRRGEPRARRAFVDCMTRGSTVQQRLSSYSSIEAEQLGSATYARVMLLLQHEYGVRIAYPVREADRSFFKAAFRVFMAAPRGDENRALQGLHWSHDAFHFALGNLTLPGWEGFDEWFDAGDELPEPLPREGAAFEAYRHALKAAEDEATFFSFWTLYEEQPSLVRHVPTLTFWAGLRELGIFDRETARAIYDDLAVRATMPARLAEHPLFSARADLQRLFEYVRGFRDYHFKDIDPAWDHASRDVYRGIFARFGVYESDPARYVANVRAFDRTLAALPPGLSPLAAEAADVRVALALRVFDVTKSMRLQRRAIESVGVEARARRAAVRRAGNARLDSLAGLAARLASLRGRVEDAELSPHNEALFASLSALSSELEAFRHAVWDDARALLAPDVIAAELARELPR